MGWGLISSGSSPIPPSFSSPTKPSSESWAVGETVETFSVRQKDRVCMCCVKSSSTHSTESCAYHAPSHLPPLSVPPFFAQLSGPYELGSHSLCVLLCLCQFVCESPPAYQEEALTHFLSILVGFHFWQHITTTTPSFSLGNNYSQI